MRATTISDKDWFPSLSSVVENGIIRRFLTQKMAIEASHKYGWGNRIIRVERRFERVWLVGAIDFQPEEIAGVTTDVLRLPLLHYETGEDGIQYQPVLALRRIRRKRESI